MKRVILCADDYAQNRAVSRGILALIRQKRLSATGCFSNSKLWAEHGQWLLPHLGEVDVGLHFNLTEGYALGPVESVTRQLELPSLSQLLLRSHLGMISVSAVKHELLRQINRFQEVMGVLPSFIDGHQHVHHFPAVRQAVLEVYQQHFRKSQIYIRCAANIMDRGAGAFKRCIIRHTGALRLAHRLSVMNIPHNKSFSGIYSFGHPERYGTLFKTFLTSIGDQGLVMCHPGFQSSDARDPLMNSRYHEYQYFSSDQFIKDLAEAGVRLCPFREFSRQQ
jgi:predicted glycoside hydrolase/deacetylase ChbG (UPF0249 family)